MALTKKTEEDKIEVTTEYRHVQVRTATVIKEDGVELSRTYHRRMIHCGKIDASDNWIDTDLTSETTEVKAIAAAIWSQSIKDAWKADLIANKD